MLPLFIIIGSPIEVIQYAPTTPPDVNKHLLANYHNKCWQLCKELTIPSKEQDCQYTLTPCNKLVRRLPILSDTLEQTGQKVANTL
jgi:hypothetical protein